MGVEQGQPHIEFRAVEVSYRTHKDALQSFSLQIKKGEFVFLVGTTGAGKSTLLKLLSREVNPSKGAVVVDGKEINRQLALFIPRLRRKMGIVPQDYALLPKKTVEENIAYASRAAGKTRRQTRRRTPFILMGVHLLHKAKSFPEELSGGERQRVAIGRSLVNDPPLILADEPTGNLDPEHSMEIMQLLLDLNDRGSTVIVATHDMLVVDQVPARIIRLEEGRIISDSGPVERPKSEPVETEVIPLIAVVEGNEDAPIEPVEELELHVEESGTEEVQQKPDEQPEAVETKEDGEDA
jgi:cell division transport system ATP-binding protein